MYYNIKFLSKGMIRLIKTKKRGNLIVLSGPSGAGKGSICKEILKNNNNIWLSVSCTSRNPRGSEKNTIDYYFLSNDEFEEKINNGEFLEYAKYNDNYYGTLKENIENKLNDGIDVILEIEVQGALQINDKIKDAIFIFIMPPSMQELKKRLTLRNTENEEKIIKRFKRAYKEINEISTYNYVVINDKLDEAVKKVESILSAEYCRVDRIIDIDLGNIEELIHEELVK